ncbi:DUF6194 family protein [Actinomadura sp. DC4]|uniref:DUF6194 family protein n=1 Tax=Actinomadura sp. DC4 TaxID=3055069 RepID=UPI0025AF5985|nr:DUF6194 family protein [Actinomadura sp. DC4]MDN3352596.1 DUF6194 family protein [Actinomadura sp. DC4]
MTEDEIIAFVRTLPGAAVITADAGSGAPEVAWGDSFFYYDPDGDSPRRMPFATLVTKDYDGFDEDSRLGRPGVFRLNVGVGRKRFEELIGHPPAVPAGDVDHTALDRLIPHPAYATQAWVAILNPGERTAGLARSLLAEAGTRAARTRLSGEGGG